jgi:hypothetical protein
VAPTKLFGEPPTSEVADKFGYDESNEEVKYDPKIRRKSTYMFFGAVESITLVG